MQAQHGVDATPDPDARPNQDTIDDTLLEQLLSAGDLVKLTEISHPLKFDVVLYVILLSLLLHFC